MSIKRATITDVAKMAGVSIGAVSRIINKDPTFLAREETRQAVARAITALGYTANPQARGLKTARSGNLAMIVPEINSPAFLPIIQGAHQAARDCGYFMMLGGIGGDGEDPELAGQFVQTTRAEGLLVSLGRAESQALANLRTLSVPSVLVNRFLDETHPHVVLDDFNGAAALVRYLIELGHTRIAFLGGLQRLGKRRIDGYKAALREAGIRFDAKLTVEAGYDRAGGELGIEKLLALSSPPTAVFATNHLVAAGAMYRAQEAGLSVPADISIASFYDGPIAELLSPRLTAVRYPLERLGLESVRMLSNLIDGNPLDSIGVVLPHEEIVVRDSTAPPPKHKR